MPDTSPTLSEPGAAFAEASPLPISLWLTRADRSAALRLEVFAGFAHGSPPEGTLLLVDPERRYQTMDGFGFALTGGSAQLIWNLPETARAALLQELFTRHDDGVGVSFLRLSIGASDLGETAFSYDDMPEGQADWALQRFSLAAGDPELIPLLQEILAINPDLNIIASPWSAPPWMKTVHSFVGGRLNPACYRVYAQYLLKYLQAMQAEGIRVAALTVQNEPENAANEPSMLMSAEEQAEFVKHHLGPMLHHAGFGHVGLFCWDHNCDHPEFPLAVLGDPDARPYLAGSAWHLYAGDIAVLDSVRALHPDKKLYFTEQWVGYDAQVAAQGQAALDAQFAGDLAWHVRQVLVGATRHGCQAVLEWNLANGPQHQPHTPGGCANCVGALTIGDGEVRRNVPYYVIAHASKFVPPGSVRVFSEAVDGMPNVAFATPQGDVVLLLHNQNGQDRRLTLACQGMFATLSLAAGDLASLVWRYREG